MPLPTLMVRSLDERVGLVYHTQQPIKEKKGNNAVGPVVGSAGRQRWGLWAPLGCLIKMNKQDETTEEDH